MLKYITDREYVELLDAESIPNNFNKLVIEASEYINNKTFGRIDINNIHENVKYTTALIIDKLNDHEINKKEIGNLKSQNIEGWSETYLDPKEIENNLENELLGIIKKYLSNVVGKDGEFLLYSGVL